VNMKPVCRVRGESVACGQFPTRGSQNCL